ncbi:MAG TPA: prolyl oligopeptidase family serine peptidase [Longimicrobiales bacterium]|nr:prolyl oligopeptidase family serine peptidase [Longimicrobiales bacterium]
MRSVRARAWSRATTSILLSAGLAATAAAQQDLYSIDDVLNATSASAGALSPDGRSLVVTTAALRDRIGIDNRRYGDPTYVAPSFADVTIVDTRTGATHRLFPDKRQTRAFSWSPDGARLAFLLRDGDVFRPAIWDRSSGRVRAMTLPPGVIAADNADLQWTDDGTRVLLATRTQAWQRAAHERFQHEVKGPIVVLKSSDPFLSWDEIRRLPLQRSLRSIDATTGRSQEILPERLLSSYRLTGSLLRYHEDITQKTDYEAIGGSQAAIRVRDMTTGTDRTLAATTRGFSPTWSGDGLSYAFTRENRIWVATLADTTPRPLTPAPPRAARDSATTPADSAARAQAARERLAPTRLSHDGTLLIASNRQGLWLIDTRTAERELLFEMPPRDTTQPAPFSVVAWSRDGSAIYLTYAARDRWERGLYRIDRTTKQVRELVRDSRRYAGWRLSDDGSTLLFTIAEGARPADIHAADADLSNVRRITRASDDLAAKKVGATRLIDYLDADGNKLHGVLYLPVDYDPARTYPTVFIVYETFFDDGFNSTVSLLTASGYAVMQPSVRLETGYPGEAWLKGVTAAANKLIELGIADGDRLGVHGTSYGGYATNLLITQTNRFKAAINISGKVDMISFYTDSPRLGVRNIHAPERSQDRIGATLWEQPQKYVAHSAIMSADRIRTPLLLMTGQQDHNVPERTTMEMYYALRRLGRDVEWVSYVNGGHGMPTSTVEEVIDYHQRILGWYDRYLKAAASRSATN